MLHLNHRQQVLRAGSCYVAIDAFAGVVADRCLDGYDGVGLQALEAMPGGDQYALVFVPFFEARRGRNGAELFRPIAGAVAGREDGDL